MIPDKVLNLREIDELEKLQELEADYEANPSKYYIPNGAIERFIRNTGGANGTIPDISLLVASNSLGKTASLINILANIFWKPQNKWFKGLPLFEDFPFSKKGRIISDPKTVKEKIIPEIEKWFPKGRYKSEKARKDYDSRFWTDTGFYMDIMTSEQERSEFESVDLGFCICDEPLKEFIFNATVRGMRPRGIIIMGLTPLTEGWIIDRLADDVDGKSKVCVRDIPMEEACEIHGTRGHLPHRFIEIQKKETDPEEYDARIEGKAMHHRGRIYKVYNPDVHYNLKMPDDRVIKNSLLFNVLDPHDVRDPAIGWYILTPQNILITIGEYPERKYIDIHSSNLSIDDYGEIIKKIETQNKWGIYKRIIDPRFAERHPTGDKSIREKLREWGKKNNYPLNFKQGSGRHIEEGHLAVRGWLKYTDKQKPRFYIVKGLQNHHLAMLRYSYKNPSGRDARDGEVEPKYKDFADLVRYLIMEKPRYFVRGRNDEDNRPRGVSGYGFS